VGEVSRKAANPKRQRFKSQTTPMAEFEAGVSELGFFGSLVFGVWDF
jgi:hypothetical protein